MVSLLSTAEESIKAFLLDMMTSLGFWGVIGIVAGVELLFITFFAIKSAFSYEARLRRTLDNLNAWLFQYRIINEGNIKRFNALVKTGPKRLVYYWQQFILYRDGGPKEYLTEENLIKKPLKTSSWANNVKNLTILTCVWAAFSLVAGLVVQASTSTLTLSAIAFSLVFPCIVLLMGVVAVLIIRGLRASNLDEIYHLHHLFIRFIQNACAELPPYIDFNLLFTPKEIEKGNANLREYYEERARKAKKEFDEARANDVKYVEYDFKDVGVDGSLLLNRAMRESEKFIIKKTKILSQIAQVETQKDTLRRNYENIQIDLQRKIQVAKENIKSLIEKQASTTSRIEAQLLKQQQDKEIAKQTELQRDYDQEEHRYNESKAELEKEIERLNAEQAQSMEEATEGMSNEYQSFFEKVMQNAYVFADKKVEEEKKTLASERDKCEDELISVQTQVKHLLDENEVLRERLGAYEPKYQQKIKSKDGKYVNGVFVEKDGSYHDEKGLFHAKDGRVYNSLGEQVSYDESKEEEYQREKQELINSQVELFGSYVKQDDETEPANEIKEMTSVVEEQANNEIAQGQISIDEIKDESVNEGESTKTEENQTQNDSIPESATVESVDFDELFNSTPAKTEGKGHSEEPQESVEAKPEEKGEETKEEPKDEGLANYDINTLWDELKEYVEENKSTEQTPNVEKPAKVAEEADEPKQETKQEVTPAKRRGRPRKVQTEEKVEPARKRGRPRKQESEKEVEPAKKRGRPRKEQPQTTAPKRKVGRPKSPLQSNAENKNGKRKSIVKKAKVEQETPLRKRGRPRKQTQADKEVDQLARINQLIHEEEAKLRNMKSIINDQLDDAIEKASQSKIEQERAEILQQVEQLQTQAIDAQHEGRVEEFSSINSRIEVLINRLAELNKQ